MKKDIIVDCWVFFPRKVLWTRWDLSRTLKENKAPEMGGRQTTRGVHTDQGTEEKVAGHQRPFGYGVNGVWFPQSGEHPSNSSSLLKRRLLPLLPREM